MARKGFKEILSGTSGPAGSSGSDVSRRAAFTQGVSGAEGTRTTRRQRTQAKQSAADEKTSSLYDTLYEKVSGSLGEEYAQELSDMRKGYETQLSESETAYGEETTRRASGYQTQLGAMQTKYESEMKAAKDQWASDFETLKGQADAYNDWATATLAERQAKMAAAQSNMTSKYNAAYAAFAEELTAQQVAQEAAIVAQQEEFQAELDIFYPPSSGVYTGPLPEGIERDYPDQPALEAMRPYYTADPSVQQLVAQGKIPYWAIS